MAVSVSDARRRDDDQGCAFLGSSGPAALCGTASVLMDLPDRQGWSYGFDPAGLNSANACGNADLYCSV